MDQGAGSHHLSIQKRMIRNQSMKIPTVSIGPIQHRGNTESMGVFQVSHNLCFKVKIEV
jgi:hypothetical protein